MAREVIDTKIRTLIEAYLTFNKGKKCSAKEIAEFSLRFLNYAKEKAN